MSVKIRLSRRGRKKVACYRVVVADGRCRRDGRFIESLGTYYPQKEPKEFNINHDRVAYWLNKGAEPSLTIKNLLKQDRFTEKSEGLKKGLSVESLGIERKSERKRKVKPKNKKSS